MLRSVAVLLLGTGIAVSGSLAFGTDPGWGGSERAKGVIGGGNVCSQFASLSGTFTATPGFTNGIVGTPQFGDTYRIAVTGPGTGTFRIVGNAVGTVTFAGPTTVPGSLAYTVTGAAPPAAIGVGFLFDAGAGSVTIGASCGPQQIPALDRWSLLALIGVLALGGIVALGSLRSSRSNPR